MRIRPEWPFYLLLGVAITFTVLSIGVRIYLLTNDTVPDFVKFLLLIW